MEARLVTRMAAYNTIERHMQGWEQTNPRPNFERYCDNPLPVFKGKKSSWSVEQKAEYAAVKKQNQEGSTEAGKPFADWVGVRYTELIRITATFPQQVQDDLRNLNDKSSWEIQEVPYSEQ
jgi:hypothetical protein